MINHTKTEVILVDKEDKEIGRMEKLETHKKGLLHRAFSVIVFDNDKRLLLQRRAFGKYHSEGLWTNTCCSHPNPGEETLTAAHRRLQEEMGFDCGLIETFHFIYRIELENDLIEHELDHIIIGKSNKIPQLNEQEAIDYKWMDLKNIQKEMKDTPELFTYWFKLIILEYFDILTIHLNNTFES